MALAFSFRKPFPRRSRRRTLSRESLSAFHRNVLQSIHDSRFAIHHASRFVLAAWTCSALLALTGCKKPSQSQTQTSPNPQSPSKPVAHRPKIEACSLLTKEEVGAIQGATIIDSKGSEHADGTYLNSQCYYSSKEANMSVSLTVTQGDPNNPAAPDAKTYWEKTFGSFDKEDAGEEGEKKEKGEGRGREEREKATPPKKIEGVGEEAFWSGNRFGGALYVLWKDVFIRTSVGGPDNEETKINKSKALAQKAIERL